ncbi:AbrB/MazE/SpoVT family DNA-binding domain-containing protein [Candidatus Kaiserbacteria bacterium]|nr:AbrB/MazE/SpoVT family DNA-binding domain-containing protein [Candidatus Kaiserbacteria bacterium]
MTTTIQKWGNSYAVRLPKTAVRKLNLRAGQSVEIREAAHGNAPFLSIIPTRHRVPPLSEMLARITKKNRHSVTDWGEAVGQEIW